MTEGWPGFYEAGRSAVAQFHINLLFSRLRQSAAVQMVHWHFVIWKFFNRWKVFSSPIRPAGPDSDLYALAWLANYSLEHLAQLKQVILGNVPGVNINKLF